MSSFDSKVRILDKWSSEVVSFSTSEDGVCISRSIVHSLAHLTQDAVLLNTPEQQRWVLERLAAHLGVSLVKGGIAFGNDLPWEAK